MFTKKQFKKLVWWFALVAMGCANSQKLTRDGYKHYDQADYDEAVKKFEKAIRKDPDHGEAYYGLSLVDAERKNYKDALNYCNLALRDGSVHGKAVKHRAKLYYELGLMQTDRDSILGYLNKAIQDDPGINPTRQKRAEIFHSLAAGKNSNAQQLYFLQNAVIDNPKHLSARQKLGSLYSMLSDSLAESGEYFKASAYLDSAGVYDPSLKILSVKKSFVNSRIYADSLDFDKAISFAKEALAEPAYFAKASYDLARYHAIKSDTVKVFEYLIDFCRTSSEQYDQYRSLAKLDTVFQGIAHYPWFRNWVERGRRIKLSILNAKNLSDYVVFECDACESIVLNLFDHDYDPDDHIGTVVIEGLQRGKINRSILGQTGSIELEINDTNEPVVSTRIEAESPAAKIALRLVGCGINAASLKYSIVLEIGEILWEVIQNRNNLTESLLRGGKDILLGYIVDQLKEKGYKKIALAVEVADCAWDIFQTLRGAR